MTLYLEDFTTYYSYTYSPDITSVTFLNLLPSTTLQVHVLAKFPASSVRTEVSGHAWITTGPGGIVTSDPDQPQPPRAVTRLDREGRSVKAAFFEYLSTDCPDACRGLRFELVGFPFEVVGEGRDEYSGRFSCYQSNRPDTLGFAISSGSFGITRSLPDSNSSQQPTVSCDLDGAEGLYITAIVDGVQSNTVRFSTSALTDADKLAPSRSGPDTAEPPDNRAVAISLGADRSRCGYSHLPCRWVGATFDGFVSGRYRLECYWSPSRGSLGTRTVSRTITVSGRPVDELCWFNVQPGRFLTAVIDGVQSNTIQFAGTPPRQTTQNNNADLPPHPSRRRRRTTDRSTTIRANRALRSPQLERKGHCFEFRL